MCTRKCCRGTVAVVGIVFLVLGCLLVAWLPDWLYGMVEDVLSLKDPTTMMYPSFVNQSAHVHVRYEYSFFNVTNWEAVQNNGTRPKLAYCGPYVYTRIKWRPEEHVFWDADGMLHYKTLEYYRFEPSLSPPGLSESDEIFTPRADLFLALQYTKGKKDMLDAVTAVMDMLQIDSVFEKRNISSVVHGYEPEFLKILHVFKKSVNPKVAFAVNYLDINKSGESVIYSGRKPSTTVRDYESERNNVTRRIGQYYKWQGHRMLPFWGDKYANTVNGSDGSLFPSRMMDRKTVPIFVDTLKRSLLGEHTSTVDLDGISLNRFTLYPPSLASMHVNPANKPFYIYESGLQPLPPVVGCSQDWVFAVLSLPFYLQCDTTNVHVDLPRGPEWSLDSSHLDIEPHAGVLLRVRNQLMASLRLRHVNVTIDGKHYEIGPTRNVPETWLPVFIAKEVYQIPKHLRDRIKLEMLLPLKLSKDLGIPLIAVGGLMFLGAIVHALFWETDDSDPLYKEKLL